MEFKLGQQDVIRWQDLDVHSFSTWAQFVQVWSTQLEAGVVFDMKPTVPTDKGVKMLYSVMTNKVQQEQCVWDYQWQ